MLCVACKDFCCFRTVSFAQWLLICLAACHLLWTFCVSSHCNIKRTDSKQWNSDILVICFYMYSFALHCMCLLYVAVLLHVLFALYVLSLYWLHVSAFSSATCDYAIVLICLSKSADSCPLCVLCVLCLHATCDALPDWAQVKCEAIQWLCLCCCMLTK